ncbi:amidohydrolase family protein [Candidatus Bipolaricaulota bacterium]
MAERIILGGALLCSADAPLQLDSGLWIKDGQVAGVGSNELLRSDHPDAEQLDARHLLLMPGLVNAHMHSYGLLAHGFPMHDVPSGFFEFLNEFWWPQVENQLDQPMIEAALRLSCCQMIHSGITSFCDVLEAPNAPDGILNVEADIARQAGLRAVLMTEASERIDVATGLRLLEENAQFVRTNKDNDVIRGMLCLHTSFTCSRDFIEQARDMMNDLGCDLHLHLSESAYEPAWCEEHAQMRPAMWYDKVGLWNGSVLASQAVDVTDDEIDLFVERGVRIAHMPLSNCEVGGGVSPVPKMIEAGIRPGLGTDGYINNLFEVMRGAFLIHKGVLRNPSVMPAQSVMHMATDWGAEAIGFDSCGSLSVGMSADVIGIDLQFDTPLRNENVFDQLILFRSPGDVDLSVIGGEVVMERGDLLTLNEEAARADALKQARRLWGEA